MFEQNVQWFPGHMAKTRRQIKESLQMVDAVTEILDARMPLSSSNPEIAEIIGRKPRIILLNKCDLADEKITEKWIKKFTNDGAYVLAVDCRTGKGINKFYNLVHIALKDRIEQNQRKGMAGKSLRVMVVGIPNTGKSSFINRMAGKNRAKVEDKPGVTRQNQWFNIGNGIELLDTPGVLWPKFDDREVGNKLAFIGSVKDTVLDMETLACTLLGVLSKEYPDTIETRYFIDKTEFDGMEPYDLLELIGKKRGMLMSGGRVNTERASAILLDEFRDGKLGRISLDIP